MLMTMETRSACLVCLGILMLLGSNLPEINFIIRLLLQCLYCSSPCRHVAQGMHYSYMICPLKPMLMAAKVGLLHKNSTEEEISHAYRYFKSAGLGNEIFSREFKAIHCHTVLIDFIRVW
jgi:hypothetical protein